MGAIAKAVQAKTPQATMRDQVQRMMPEIAKALPSVITPERFTRMTMSALSTTPALAKCTTVSFLGAMMNAAQLGLEPNTPMGQCYIIPFDRKGTAQATLVIGYKGLIDLAYRSGQVSTITAQVVHENDEFEYELGLEPKLLHKPAMKDRGAPVWVYAMYRTKDGGYGFEVMSIEDIRKHAQRFSKSPNKGPWVDNFEEMAKKTVLKRVLKYAPLRTDVARAVNVDEGIRNDLEAEEPVIEDVEFSVDEEVTPDATSG